LNFHLLGIQKPAGLGDRGGNRSDQRKRDALRSQGVDADAVAADEQIARYKTVLKSV
jgi:hypothetical protein